MAIKTLRRVIDVAQKPAGPKAQVAGQQAKPMRKAKTKKQVPTYSPTTGKAVPVGTTLGSPKKAPKKIKNPNWAK